MPFILSGLVLRRVFLAFTVMSAGLGGSSARSEPVLLYAYGLYQSPPDIQLEGRSLVGGYMYEIGRTLGQGLNTPVEFLEIPRKRLSTFLEEGRVDVRCHLSPKWLEDSDFILWSQPLYTLASVIAVRKQSMHGLTTLNDFVGKRIGVVRGYRYSQILTDMSEAGDVVLDTAGSSRDSLRMLASGRIDGVAGTRKQLEHLIAELGMGDEIAISQIVLREQPIHCAVSAKAQIEPKRILQAINNMHKRGAFEAIRNNSGS